MGLLCLRMAVAWMLSVAGLGSSLDDSLAMVQGMMAVRRQQDDEAAQAEQHAGAQTIPVPFPIPVGVFPMEVAIPMPTDRPELVANPFKKERTEEWKPDEEPVWHSPD